MINVYEQVTYNKRRSWFIIFLFIVFITGSVWAISQALELDLSFTIFALLFSIATSLISYFKGDQIILALNNAKPASRRQFFNFYTATENLSLAAGIPMPKIYYIDSTASNAFATGRDPDHAVVCATTGLLQQLNRSQLEAVIAHELSHIKNFDIRLMMIVSILLGSLTIIIRNARFFRKRDNKKSNVSGIIAIIGLVLLILSPIIAKLIQLALSRQREYLADAAGVKLTRQPQSLIEALKIISQNPNPLGAASPATAHLYISNPFKNTKLSSLFSTHPPIQKRIAALSRML